MVVGVAGWFGVSLVAAPMIGGWLKRGEARYPAPRPEDGESGR